MIITITGKPCSGKNAVIDYIADKYGFEKFLGGDIFRRVATERGIDILELNRKKDTSIDKFVDEEIARIGKERLEEDIIFSSRTAWYFIPESFKVFLDVDEDEQARRLLSADRADEKTNVSLEQAKKDLKERFDLENERYYMLYKIDNTNPDRYDCVVNNTNLTIEQTGEEIMRCYKKFVENRKK